MNASIVKSSRLAPSRAAIRPGARRLVAISKAEQGNNSTEEVDKVPPGCSRYIAKLAKPLGIVLEETKDGRLLVGDVQVGGNAERYNETATADRIIRKGDQIVAVSGFTRAGASQTYGETEVRGGEKMVRVIVMAQPQDKYVSKTSTCAQLPGGTLTRPDSLTRACTRVFARRMRIGPSRQSLRIRTCRARLLRCSSSIHRTRNGCSKCTSRGCRRGQCSCRATGCTTGRGCGR